MWLFRPVRLAESRGPREFIRRVLLQQFLVKVLVAVPIALLVPQDAVGQSQFIREDPIFAIVAILLFAPVIETLVLQGAMIEPLRLFRRSRLVQFIAGAVPFAALHFFDGIHAGVAAGVVGGIYFSHTYLECRARSWWAATKFTTMTHFLHNLIVAPFALGFALLS